MPATNPFPGTRRSASAPYSRSVAITPHDTDELTNVTSAIYVGGAGNVKLTTVGGDTVTFIAVPVGTILPVRAKLVFSTLTTATNLVALW